jgi:S1-C subfamily serine protease
MMIRVFQLAAFLSLLHLSFSSNIKGQEADDTYSVIDKVKQATVYIVVEANGSQIQTGTGFLISREETSGSRSYLVITNAHVVTPPSPNEPGRIDRIICVRDSGLPDEFLFDLNLVGVDEKNDLAVLEPSRSLDLRSTIIWNDDSVVRETDQAFIVGFPFGDKLATSSKHPNVTISQSAVSSIRTDDSGKVSLIQLSGGINPGNSGGPVVSKTGGLIGIAVAKVGGSDIGFAIPKQRLQELLAGKFTNISITRSGDSTQSDNFEITMKLCDPWQNTVSASLEIIPRKGDTFKNLQSEWVAGAEAISSFNVKIRDPEVFRSPQRDAIPRDSRSIVSMPRNPNGYLARTVIKLRDGNLIEGDLFVLNLSKGRLAENNSNSSAPTARLVPFAIKNQLLVRDAAFSKDQLSCYLATREGEIRKYSLEDFSLQASVSLTAYCGQIANTKEGIAVFLSRNSEILILDETDLKTKKTIKVPITPTVAFSANLGIAYLQSEQDSLDAVDLKSGRIRSIKLTRKPGGSDQKVKSRSPEPFKFRSMSVTHDGKYVIAMSEFNALSRVRIQGSQGIVEEISEDFRDRGNRITVSADSKRFASPGLRIGSASGVGTSVIPINDFRKQDTAIFTDDRPLAVAFDPVTKNIYTQGDKELLSVYSDKGGLIGKYGRRYLEREAQGIIPHPSGNRVILVFEREAVWVELGDDLGALGIPARGGAETQAPQESSEDSAESKETSDESEKEMLTSVFRTWSDASGKYKVEAKMLKIEDQNVVLEKKDGSTVNVPIEKLCDEDKRLIDAMRK